MALLIPILGVAADYRVPGGYAQIEFAQGPASASAGVREVVLVMPMLSTGTYVAGTLYKVGNSKDVETGGGAGSPLHRGAHLFMQANKDAKLWALPVAETTGGSPIAATATVTYVNAATGTGTAVVTVCGEDCSFTFANGASITSIAAGISAAINAKTWLPCTSSPAVGVVTLTAKLKGISQGTATIGVIRIRASITSGVATTATASGAHLGTVAAGVEGSTTEGVNTQTALASIDATRKYYIVSSLNDATALAFLKTHINTKSEPRRGLRSVGIFAWTHTLAAGQTIANALNYERLDMAWQKNSEHDCAEIAANLAAIRQKHEQVDSTHNFDGYSGADWLIKPAYANVDWPNTDDQNDAITDGITVIASNDARSYVVMSVNTRSKNAAGTVDDFRATETHRVSGCDEFVDEELADFALNFANKKLEDDERLADGTVNTNQVQKRNVVKPSVFKKHILKRMEDFGTAGKLQEVAASKESLICVKSPANSGRLECGFDLHVVDLLHQATYRCAEVSTG